MRPTAIALTLSLLTTPAPAATPPTAIGIENQYANIIAQIAGPNATVTAIVSNPNTDPHEFEVSPRIAAQLAAASLVVQNGLGYDNWAGKLLAASPNPTRQIINVQHLLNLPDSTPNPHLWYAPTTMPTLATAIAKALATINPSHAATFQTNAQKFQNSLTPLITAIAAFKSHYPHTPIAVTEPVADDLLQALGANIVTPFTLQAAIMNGTDPAPQDVTFQTNLFTSHSVKILVYNQQVTDPLTQSFLATAKAQKIPIVGVYETMPAPGYTYQTWMQATLAALTAALTTQKSTQTLLPAP